MKRRIFLTSSALALAIVSTLAVNANRKSLLVHYYFTPTSCVTTNIPDQNACTGTKAECQYDFGAGLQTIYKSGTATACTNPYREVQ